jgi:hypothetical protein
MPLIILTISPGNSKARESINYDAEKSSTEINEIACSKKKMKLGINPLREYGNTTRSNEALFSLDATIVAVARHELPGLLSSEFLIKPANNPLRIQNKK